MSGYKYPAICGVSEEVVEKIHAYWEAYNVVYTKLYIALEDFFGANVDESPNTFRKVMHYKLKLHEMEKSYIKYLDQNDIDYWDLSILQEVQDLIRGVGIKLSDPSVDEELQYIHTVAF